GGGGGGRGGKGGGEERAGWGGNGRSSCRPPAQAMPVAAGGCACATARTSGRFLYTVRCRPISENGLPSPEMRLPSASTTRSPAAPTTRLDTAVGVHRKRPASTRQVTFPSWLATQPRAWSARATSAQASRNARSVTLAPLASCGHRVDDPH